VNQPLLKYIFGFCIATFLWACSDDTRQSSRIPPLPAFNNKNRIQKSIEFLSKAIKRNSRSATAYYKRAELYAEIRQWTEALDDINKALDINPNRGIFLISRARVLRQLRQYDKALIDARRAEGLKESLPGLYTILGDLMQQKRQLKQADLYLNRALQMSPFDGEAYFYKGTLSAKQGDTTTAITLIEQGLALKPRFMPPYNELTNIYTYLGDYGRALYYNNLGIKYFPYEAPLQFARGQLYRRKLRLDSALIFYVNASMEKLWQSSKSFGQSCTPKSKI
jgi:tetratricopeptide (TPR) repeat protein